MTMSMRVTALLTGACIMGIFAVRADPQTTGAETRGSIDVAVTYDAAMANVVRGYGFSMQGAGVQVLGGFYRGWGMVADGAGLHAAMLPHSTAGLNLVTVDFGPRYTWSPAHHRLALFGQVLVGQAFGMNSIFPTAGGTSSSANSLALQMGGGMSLPLSRRLSVRAFEADWLRTQLPNATTNVQNNLRLGAGLVFRVR